MKEALSSNTKTVGRTLGVEAFALILVAILFSVSGEMLIKYGVNQMGVLSLDPPTLLATLFRAFSSPFVVGGFGLVFCGSVFWLAALSRVDLSYAYPMLSIGYVLAVIGSWVLLQEPVSYIRLAGVLVICTGVFIVSRG